MLNRNNNDFDETNEKGKEKVRGHLYIKVVIIRHFYFLL